MKLRLSYGLAAMVWLFASFQVLAQGNPEAYGTKPVQGEAQQLALEVLKDVLKDPYSAQIEWTEIVGTSSWEDSGPPCFGWVLFASVNAKNSYGGYAGAKDYRFFIRNGRVDCAITSRRLAGRSGRVVDVRVY